MSDFEIPAAQLEVIREVFNSPDGVFTPQQLGQLDDSSRAVAVAIILGVGSPAREAYCDAEGMLTGQIHLHITRILGVSKDRGSQVAKTMNELKLKKMKGNRTFIILPEELRSAVLLPDEQVPAVKAEPGNAEEPEGLLPNAKRRAEIDEEIQRIELRLLVLRTAQDLLSRMDSDTAKGIAHVLLGK